MTFDGKDTDEGDRRADEMLDAFRKFWNTCEGKRQGWNRFCEELGVEATALTAPFTEHVEIVESILESAYETSQELGSNLDAEERQVRSIADAEHRALSEAWADSVRG